MSAPHGKAGRSERAAEEWIEWASENFGERAAFASSFGAEDMVLLDMIARVESGRARGIRVVTLDTGRLFPETYDLIEEARKRYRVTIRVYVPDREEVEELVSRAGPNLFYTSVENRRSCCAARKVRPLERALRGAEAWITGLRREQSSDRAGVEVLAKDPAHGGIWKISPLAEWRWEDVLAYADRHSVPLNRLHARGFPSVGCAPCTRAVRPGEDPRSGRWWWESGPKECGLHRAGPGSEMLVPSPRTGPVKALERSPGAVEAHPEPPSRRKPVLARDVLIL